MPSIVKAGYVREVEAVKRTETADTDTDSKQKTPQLDVTMADNIDEEAKERLLGQELLALRNKVDAEGEIIVLKAREKAKIVLEEAEERARQILAEAQANAEIIYRESETVGYEQGNKRGLREGLACSDEKIKACTDDIREMVQYVRQENSRMLEDNEKDLVQLSFEIAKKIMRQQIKVDDEAIPKMIEEIIRENEKTVKVYLSEINRVLRFKVDRRMYSKIKALSENLRVIVIKDDEEESRRDTIQVETETGMIDAGIDGQMKRLKAEMELDDMPGKF